MRQLDIVTLDNYAREAAAGWLSDRPPFSREFLKGEFYKFHYLDEWNHLVEGVEGNMSGEAAGSFRAMIDGLRAAEPRTEKVLAALLKQRMAIDLDGEHIPGTIGKAQLDKRLIGLHMVTVETSDSVRRRKRLGLPKTERETENRLARHYWPIYMGEGEERIADSGVADALPPGTPGLPLGALNTRIANVIALKACDVIVDELDTGTADGMIEGRDGAQPTDPDTTVTGLLLFAHDLATPAFGAAVDAAPGGIATAGTIADDVSADNTGTLGYCRASSSNAFPTPLIDLIDGEAGTSGADYNYNTLSIVSGSTVKMTSWTVTMAES